LKAFLVFIDESGLLMAPLVRRSWAPQGQTPILYHRTRSHRKVSVIAALCIAPTRDRIHLFFRLHSDANINAPRVSDFLTTLKRHLRKRAVLVWDRFLPHRAKTVQSVIGKRHIHAYFLPPYAPELNPVEYGWSYLKINSMANLVAVDLQSLTATTRSHGRPIQRKQCLLRSFVKHAPLSLRLK